MLSIQNKPLSEWKWFLCMTVLKWLHSIGYRQISQYFCVGLSAQKSDIFCDYFVTHLCVNVWISLCNHPFHFIFFFFFAVDILPEVFLKLKFYGLRKKLWSHMESDFGYIFSFNSSSYGLKIGEKPQENIFNSRIGKFMLCFCDICVNFFYQVTI